jgi:hypothetical protein
MKPWHQVVTPRKDLREGKPLDASEFAIHLHQVVRGTAPADYVDPRRFFERTFITRGLGDVAVEVIRRLAGQTVNAAPVINLTTPFGGGKTHALTLLYHLFRAGPEAARWLGVDGLLKTAGIAEVPKAIVATFVGTEFDPVSGQTGAGEPTRMTPWGDLAWQLGGKAAFDVVAEHDRMRVRPGGDVLRRILPSDTPVLILMDEVLNFLNAARAIKAGDTKAKESTLASQFMAFVQTLNEEAAGRTGLVLVMALPRSEMEMSPEDEADHSRLQKLSSRVDRPYILSEGMETAEIIRRRLFESLGSDSDRRAVVRAYAKAIDANRELLPQWFSPDRAIEAFEASYPFHPTVLSVFERKWQTLPTFQRTRGVLRMLALWVSQSFLAAYKGGRREPLITLGMAPLDDAHFRAAVLEQLGEGRLEAPILADIAGPQAHAVQLDRNASPALQASRIHQSVASAVFFESSGGQVKVEASLPEVRLDLGAPDLELGHLETALSGLMESCYYLIAEGARYHFSLRQNLNKRLADIRAGLEVPHVEARVREQVQSVFKSGGRLERRFFPERSGDVPNAPALALVVLAPGLGLAVGERERTLELINSLLSDAGSSSRAYKSALFFAVPESGARIHEAARRVLAWEALNDESRDLSADDLQRKQVADQLNKARRDLTEAVWQTYHTVLYLAPGGDVAELDLGLLHSSASETLPGLIEARLRQQDLLVDAVSPDFLARNWPPALPRWPLHALRDAFFSSPRLPRLTNVDALRTTIERGVGSGVFGLARTDDSGVLSSVRFEEPITELDIDFSRDSILISREEAAAAKAGLPLPAQTETLVAVDGGEGAGVQKPDMTTIPVSTTTRGLTWAGDLPLRKWASFYTKVLTRFALMEGVRVHLKVDIEPPSGLTKTQMSEAREGFAELELSPPTALEHEEA